MSQEIIFYKNLSYEFGKDVQRLETENAELRSELSFHKGEAMFYREQFHKMKKSPAATEDSLDKYLNTSIPDIFKGREQECQKK